MKKRHVNAISNGIARLFLNSNLILCLLSNSCKTSFGAVI